MSRQLFVEKSLIGGQQVDDARVFFQLSVEKQFRLFDKRGAQIVIEEGKLGAVRIEQPDVPGLQPVRKEIFNQ